MNFFKFELRTTKPFSGLLSGKLTASCFPTLAPEGAQTLPRYDLSETISISIVLLPLLLYSSLPFMEVIFGILF